LDRIAVFGDVHGKSDMLKKLIKKVRKKHPDIEIYSLGDLIDRGPDSKGVIQVCIDENVKGIVGNHDQWLQELVVKKLFDPFCIKPIMGGAATLKSYGVDMFSDGVNHFPKGRPYAQIAMELLGSISKEQAEWISKLPSYRKIQVGEETFWLLHAGLTEPNAASFKEDSDDKMMKGIEEKNVNTILWPSPFFGTMERPDNLYHFNDAVQVFGHRPNKKPIIKDHFIAMDTGCGTCEPFTLSAVILPDRKIVRVKEAF